MTRKANAFALRCNPLRVTTTMTFWVGGFFHLFRDRLFSLGSAVLFSGSSNPWGAGRTCLSLALFKANSSPVLNLSRRPSCILFCLGAGSWLCGDRSLTLFKGITNSRPVFSLSRWTLAGGACFLPVAY
jgi:hypothetical protein